MSNIKIKLNKMNIEITLALLCTVRHNKKNSDYKFIW